MASENRVNVLSVEQEADPFPENSQNQEKTKKNRVVKTKEEKLTAIREEREKLKEKDRILAKREEKLLLSPEEKKELKRKRETRQKIILGGAVIRIIKNKDKFTIENLKNIVISLSNDNEDIEYFQGLLNG